MADVNRFKAALAAGQPQIGLWVALASANVAELLGHCGYDWLLIDGEHAPNDLPLMQAQLQAMQAGGSHAVVRIPVGEVWMVKQALDIGAQTILVPMVDTAAEAAEMARAMRYPPAGIRGMGAALARASRFGMDADYVTTANGQVCLLVQVESRKALENLDAICAVDGVDGVFIGPADLSADMGFPGNSGAPQVQAAIADAMARIVASGKAAGILVGGAEAGQRAVAQGATFVAIGSDVGVLRQGAQAMRAAMDAT